MVGICPDHFALQAQDFLFAVLHARFGSYNLGIQFRHFQHRQDFPGAYLVANIDIDFSDITGHFGVKLNFLIRHEFAGNRKAVGNRASLYHRHRGGRACSQRKLYLPALWRARGK